MSDGELIFISRRLLNPDRKPNNLPLNSKSFAMIDSHKLDGVSMPYPSSEPMLTVVSRLFHQIWIDISNDSSGHACDSNGARIMQ